MSTNPRITSPLTAPPIARRTVLGLMGAAAGAAALPLTAPPRATAADGADLTFVDNGTTATLGNGIIQFTVVKATAEIKNLRLVGSKQGNENLNLLSGSHGHGYTTFNYTGVSAAGGMSGASFRVVSESPDRIEVSVLANDPTKLRFYLDIRIALERGASGIHQYWIVKYTDNMPDGLSFGQLRYAFAADDPAFRWFQVDDARGIQQRPSLYDAAHWTTLQDTTYALPDGSIWSKYQNVSNLEGDNHVFMISNGSVGLSLIQASKEAFGGPTRQELTCHDYYSGMILLWHPLTSHYGEPEVAPERGWEKVYGPFYLHVGEAAAGDERANVAALWEDAKHASAREQAAWPYAWVSGPAYAAQERSTVSGKLTVASLGAVDNGWAVLYQPGPDRKYQGVTLDGTDWQYLNLDYIYSAKIGPGGRFTIPAVRPGTYTLAAFTKGAMGEYRRENITVAAGTNLDTGNHVWHPTSHGPTLWLLGTPDRTSEEFYVHGGPYGFRRTLTWLEYPYEFPNGVDFTVGVDDPAKKWNYFHPAVKTPGTAAQLAWRGTTPNRELEAWKIRFDAHRYERGTGYLDIALAAQVFATLEVTLNGTSIASIDPLPGVPGDNSSYRLVARSMYRELPTITFPATLIQEGENVITLAHTKPPQAPTTDNWMQPMAGVMYDAIRLQVNEGH
ncbi:polysaccharide lyase family protein [Sinomonas sp. G460-2]|uniref:polysaccharide lyase family protein n=1 Tax=Sinomonas sp. G460-2 TaxID=3393464 RepID=UPI0039EE4178